MPFQLVSANSTGRQASDDSRRSMRMIRRKSWNGTGSGAAGNAEDRKSKFEKRNTGGDLTHGLRVDGRTALRMAAFPRNSIGTQTARKPTLQQRRRFGRMPRGWRPALQRSRRERSQEWLRHLPALPSSRTWGESAAGERALGNRGIGGLLVGSCQRSIRLGQPGAIAAGGFGFVEGRIRSVENFFHGREFPIPRRENP